MNTGVRFTGSSMHVTLALAQRVERTEIEFCATLAGLERDHGGRSLEAGGGRALYAAPDSPLNKMLGLGLGADVTASDLDAIERFYGAVACPIQIELCPYVSPDLLAKLSERGYVLRAFENELGAPMDRLRPLIEAPAASEPSVEIVTAADGDQWLDVVVQGFAVTDGGRDAPPTTDEARAAIRRAMKQFSRPSVWRYLARIDGEPAGGCGSYVHDGILGIFGTATIPRFRRRGVQQAVVARAVRDGLNLADMAVATTEPGSTSQRTFERAGFQVLYTRAILVKPHPRSTVR